MIVQKLHSVRGKLEKRETLRRTRTESGFLEQIQAHLKSLRRDVKRTTSELQSVQGILDEDVQADVVTDARQVLATIRHLREDFDAGKSRVVQIRELTNIAPTDEWERKLSVEWEKYFDQQVEGSHMLARIFDPYISHESRSKLNRLHEQLQMCRRLPRSPEDIGTFNEAITEYKAEIDALATDFPASVQAFLQKLNVGEASVLDMSPDILVWCQEKGLAGRLRIRLAGHQVGHS